MNSAINEAYISALPSLHGKPKVSIDLNCFKRFETGRKELTISFAVRAINIIGKDALPERMRIHVNEAGNVVVLMEDAQNGFELRQMRGYRRFIGVAEALRFLAERGVNGPVQTGLVYDGELGGWVARLPRQCMAGENQRAEFKAGKSVV